MAFAQFNCVAVELSRLFQFNLLSILTQRYFTESVKYNLFQFKINFTLKSRGFFLGLKIISSIFETFNEILLALSQFVRFFWPIFKGLFILFSDLLMIRRFVCLQQNDEFCNVLLLHVDHLYIAKDVTVPKQILLA